MASSPDAGHGLAAHPQPRRHGRGHAATISKDDVFAAVEADAGRGADGLVGDLPVTGPFDCGLRSLAPRKGPFCSVH